MFSMTNTPTHSQMLDRYANTFGGNRADGAKLLREIFDAHTGVNLVHALCYWGFTTVAQAQNIAKVGQ